MKETSMACEDIELRLSNMRGKKRDLEDDLDPEGPPTLTVKARELAQANLDRIVDLMEQINLAACIEAIHRR
jgi:hypothetical protein